ncbi:response regulator [Roseivivax sp. CAU 1753]
MNVVCTPLDIILVEDDDFDAKEVRRTLARTGTPVNLRRFIDGVDAFKFLKGDEGKLLKRFVILLDLNMPRMSGLGFLAAIRADARLKSMVVIIMTTSLNERDISAAYELNVAGYLLKGRYDGQNEPILGTLHRYWQHAELPVLR